MATIIVKVSLARSRWPAWLGTKRAYVEVKVGLMDRIGRQTFCELLRDALPRKFRKMVIIGFQVDDARGRVLEEEEERERYERDRRPTPNMGMAVVEDDGAILDEGAATRPDN